MQKSVRENIPETPYPISVICEIIGTAVLMYMGCLCCYNNFKIGPVIPAFGFAFAILISAQGLDAVNPCHINPAVSLAVLILGHMDWKRCIVYIISQYIGALIGYGALWLSVPHHDGLCFLARHGVSVGQAFFLEFISTFLLTLIIFGTILDTTYKEMNDSKYLRIIFGIGGLVLAVEPFTGCGINPARSLPPVIFYKNWTDHWVYELAPYAGGMTSALICRFILDREEKFSLHRFLLEKFYPSE